MLARLLPLVPSKPQVSQSGLLIRQGTACWLAP